ncbi:MAG TPA: T9SS type A sorting domain-containing protein [Salinivirgaceae bacterium]|nr:T9SS type A sorting domain-containing protein [Salinivirgaceae bacterium]
MKRIKISLIFVLISLTSTFGQNFQTINSNRIAFFENEYNNVKAVRIDSVKYQNDSLLFPFTTIQQFDYDCFSPFEASWIGKSVIIKNNGLNEFVNKMGDTISIKTDASLGDTWIAFALYDSLTIEASVVSYDTLTFIGITDSVKTIKFQVYDKNMNLLNWELNNMNIRISKFHGFVTTLNFSLFPNCQFYNPYDTEILEEYNLTGLSNPKAGVSNLTWFEVNDFQVGDELHVLDESSCWNIYGTGSATTNKAIYKYLERTDYSDSIVYRYSRKQSIHTVWTDSSDFKYYDDTLTTTIKTDPLFDKLPGEPIIENELITYSFRMKNDFHLSKFNLRGFEIYSFDGSSCWNTIILDGCLKENQYIKGLGGPYYYCNEAFCLGGAERRLVYYKKGGVTWGNPLTITGISDASISSDITIFPNPTKNQITVDISDGNYQDLQIFIYDIQGKLQKTECLEPDNSTINISSLDSGVYILKISDNDKVLKMDRLIIE